ncbi:MAG: right-handed parallel beta-helix repeat-containing protein [Bacteroides sp.]|nr:right-handed parallel beta-helix repeat-containing protein [Bacteroides sp.]
MKVKVLLLNLLLASSLQMFAQSVVFQDDALKRGYYDRPYSRYEAEPGKCQTSGSFLPATDNQEQVQSEASNQTACLLAKQKDYIEWRNDHEANGMTIHFSLPDVPDGKGLKGKIAVYVNSKFVKDVELDSYWAWQYALKTGQTYPDNTPAEDKFARMRFDEVHTLLPLTIPAGATVRIEKQSHDNIPYTIDFIELEKVKAPTAYADITASNRACYSADKGDLADFIAKNGGKTIYIPEENYTTSRKIIIPAPHTSIVGAGMWYTSIFFDASSDRMETYNQRGIACAFDNCLVDSLFLNTVNNKRYYLTDSRYQVGKALMGSFGKNSTIRNVWAEHFECGGWIDEAENLTVTGCHFRNNYADGINLSYGSKNSTVSHCSFRNNGDDDMASWSRGDVMCEGICYSYNTAENNWRASSIGFFGGKNHTAKNLVIIDPLEAGARVTTDFPGREFSKEGTIRFENISIYHGGCAHGKLGSGGDFISGAPAGAVHITSYLVYDLRNVVFNHIDIYQARDNAIFIDCLNGKKIWDLRLENITAHSAGGNGIVFNQAAGTGFYKKPAV